MTHAQCPLPVYYSQVFTYLIIVSPDELRGAEDVVQTFLQHLSVLLVGQDTEHWGETSKE